MEHDEIVVRLDVIIALLARREFPADEVRVLVTKSKKNPRGYIAAYNGLDGSTTLTDLAKNAAVTVSALSQVIDTWEAAGIVVNLGTKQAPKYRHITTI